MSTTSFFSILLITLQCIICSAIVQHSAYHPVFEYDVPVASQPLVYTAPVSAVQSGPYYGSYAVHTTPAVSHTYSQTQTHPVAYVKPVTVFGSASGQYGPSAATSRVEHSRLVVPQTNRIYRYQSVNLQPAEAQYGNEGSERRGNQQRYSNPARYNENQYRGNSQGYANQMPYINNGEQVKLRRYQIHRPGIKKEFYDVEERVIVRPAGSALIELDPPIKKQDITEYRPNDRNHLSNQYQYNSRRFNANSQSDSPSGYNSNEQYFSTAVPDCGYGYDQSPVYEYSPPATSFDNSDTNYHPTTFAPATTTTTTGTADNYPTTGYPTTGYPITDYPTTGYPTTGYPTTVPSQTYLPPYSTEQSFTPSSSTEYTPITTYSSTPAQYTPTTDTTSTVDSSTTPKQSDIYISSTTPVSVTIIDKNDEPNQNSTGFHGKDIIYAGQGQSNENADQFQNELPPRGDVSQYRAEQPDQFYHELPRSQYTNEPDRPVVYARSHGEPSTGEPIYGIETAEVIEIEPKSNNFTNNRNQSSYGNDQQARLIQLYTDNGGVSEVGQTENPSGSRYTYQNNRNAQYQDAGNVRARVVSVTPPPATALPTETVNRRRIVVSKPVTTIQEIVESDNSTKGNSNFDNNSRNQLNRNGQYQSNHESDNNRNNNNENNFNTNSNLEFNRSYKNANYRDSNEFNSDTQTTRANYEETRSGVHISTTPSSASQRIIYVQPVSQEFAQQRAVPPKKH